MYVMQLIHLKNIEKKRSQRVKKKLKLKDNNLIGESLPEEEKKLMIIFPLK